MDLFLIAAEPSADLHGSALIQQLLLQRPSLKIAAVAGPRMRALPIQTIVPMEGLQVMGFIDVFLALPRLIRLFFSIRKKILTLQPKAVVCVDYPGFNLRIARSLKRKGYRGKLIHYICPTVWAWGKKRIPLMEQTLDLLLTLLPFEPKCFQHTSLPVLYVGHPLVLKTQNYSRLSKYSEPILALFPGSREAEIHKNFPLQKAVALRLKKLIPSLEVKVSCANPQFRSLLESPFTCVEDAYELMSSAYLALATSGTVTLELALFQTPTVVHYAIRPLDCFLAQKVFRINLPHYCLVNIIAEKRVFPELFGPQLTEESLFKEAVNLWQDTEVRALCRKGCQEVRILLGERDASKEAAKQVLDCVMLFTNGNSHTK